MKRILAFLSLFLGSISMVARADVRVSFDAQTGLASIDPHAKVWIKCFNCETYRPRLKEALSKSGYRVLDDAAAADVRVVFAATVSVPQDGATPLLTADDIGGRELPSVPPALSGAAAAEHRGTPRGALDLDAGAILEGAKLTGGAGGGLVVAAGASLLAGWLQRNAADAERMPGIVRMTIRVDGNRLRQGVRLVAAADTPETPTRLLDAAFEAALQALAKGLPGGGQ